MKNGLRNRVLSFALSSVLIFSSQFIFVQKAVAQTQDSSVSAQTQTSPEAATLERKKQALLKLISLINKPEDIKKLYDFFVVQQDVMANYVDEKSLVEVLDLAMTGMVEGLDPYSHLFIDEKAEALYKEFTEESNYAGIGITITSLHKNIFVTEVFDNSPSAKAGIQAGDAILEVAGKSVYGLDVFEVGKLVQGGEGTSVTIEIKNQRLQKPKTVIIVRQKIIVESISFRDLGKDVVYAKIRSFLPDGEVVNRFQEVLAKVSNKKLIIDLRGNGGGSLHAVNRMVGFLVGPDKLLINIKERDGESSVMTPRESNPAKPPAKIAVLTDNFSASASEIMAGTLKHYKAATIIGVRTFGKATVQNYLGLDTPGYRMQGSRLIMGITIARYFLPDGTNITENGVHPNIEVEQSDNFRSYDYMTKKDTQLQAALKFLKNK